MNNKDLTIVLVHGAFADGSSWSEVIQLLQQKGYTVVVPSNPLRGVAADSDYTASVLKQIAGPVLLVGHSYGGVVITNAAAGAKNVVGLVYVAAFAPDEGEKLIEVAQNSRDSVLNTSLIERQYPTGQSEETATEYFINPKLFRETFAYDLPSMQTAILAATQRQISEYSFTETNKTPAWKKLRSWAVVATGDKVIGTDLVRSMAKRAQADITEIEGSHVITLSKPKEVTDVILKAVQAVTSSEISHASM